MLSTLLILCTVLAEEHTGDELDVSWSELQFVDLIRGKSRTVKAAITNTSITQTNINEVLIQVGGRRTEGGSDLGNGFL